MKVITVEVHSDHLQRLTKTKPRRAVAELIWNGLDAEATRVEVRTHRTALDALEQVVVTDNGHGMSAVEVEGAFGALGGSWKRLRERTRNDKRVLHGKEGLGRFRAFTIGPRVTWLSVAATADGKQRVTVTGSLSEPGRFTVADTEDVSADEQPGTTVTIEAHDEGVGQLLTRGFVRSLTATLTPYLMLYPDVEVVYDGQVLDPSVVIDRDQSYDLELEPPAEMRVIEWTEAFDRSLVLCDEDGFAIHELKAGVHAPGYDFTCYLKSDAFADLGSDIAVGELHPSVQPVVEAAREKLREHFRQRALESSREIVDGWVADGVYPFAGAPQTPIEEAERSVFDVVAVQVQREVPNFDSSAKKNRQLSLRLLKEALERSPSSVHAILSEVLDLSDDKQEELAGLIGRTSLSAIISATRTVTDRLDFIAGLEELLFDRDSKRQLLERRQLHRILVDQTWIFGERFALTVDDRSLSQVLLRHLKSLGRSPEEIEFATQEQVTRPDRDGVGIIDLMLSRLSTRGADQREHLVVELKRPNVRIGADELNQIESYAFAVAGDDRFRDTDTAWEFWVISNELDDFAKRRARQARRPPGLVHDDRDAQIRIWAKTWSEIVEDCERRMTFYQEQLGYSPTVDQAREHLRTHFAEYLPPSLGHAPSDTVPDGARAES